MFSWTEKTRCQNDSLTEIAENAKCLVMRKLVADGLIEKEVAEKFCDNTILMVSGMKYPANFDGGPVMDDEGGITIWISSLNPKEEDV